MPTASEISAAQSNRAFFGLLADGKIAVAADMATNFTRTRIRETSAFVKVMPDEPIKDSDLDPQLHTSKPVKLVNREPNQPVAITIPLGTQPIQYYPDGDRYPVYFDRIVTPKFIQDMGDLRTYGYDIRQVFTDNAVLDLDFEFDRKMLAACASIVGAEGSTVPETGIVQNAIITSAQGITRAALVDGISIMPQTGFHLNPATVLCNNWSVFQVAKWGRDEVGGDLSQEMLINSFNQKKFLNVNWIVSNKHELIPNNVFWVFASPEFLGKSFVLEDTAIYLKKEAWNLEWFAWCERGATLASPAGIVRFRVSVNGT